MMSYDRNLPKIVVFSQKHSILYIKVFKKNWTNEKVSELYAGVFLF